MEEGSLTILIINMHLPFNCAFPGNIHTHPIWRVTGSIKVMEKLLSKGDGVEGGRIQTKKLLHSRRVDVFWDTRRKKSWSNTRRDYH